MIVFSTVKRGGKSLFLLIISLFFVSAYFSSCAKEEVAPDASAEVVAARKKGEGSLEKDVDPNAGCTCYMRITEISNIENRFWEIEDLTEYEQVGGGPNPAFYFNGIGNSYLSGGSSQPFPTPFAPLDPPDAGCHKLLFSLTPAPGPQEPSVVFHTVVQCYAAGSSVPSTTTYHNFVFQDGQIVDPLISGGDVSKALIEYRAFWRLFSCLYLSYDGNGRDPSDCSPPPK